MGIAIYARFGPSMVYLDPGVQAVEKAAAGPGSAAIFCSNLGAVSCRPVPLRAGRSCVKWWGGLRGSNP